MIVERRVYVFSSLPIHQVTLDSTDSPDGVGNFFLNLRIGFRSQRIVSISNILIPSSRLINSTGAFNIGSGYVRLEPCRYPKATSDQQVLIWPISVNKVLLQKIEMFTKFVTSTRHESRLICNC